MKSFNKKKIFNNFKKSKKTINIFSTAKILNNINNENVPTCMTKFSY